MLRSNGLSSVAQSKSLKRRILTRGGATLATVGVVGGLVAREQYQTAWGTLEAPRFVIQEDPRHSDEAVRLPAFDSKASCEWPAPAWDKERIPRVIETGSSPLLREIMSSPSSSVDIDEHLVQRFGPPAECARLVFASVVGEPLPATAQIVIVSPDSWPSEHYSGSNHLGALGISLVKGQSYLDTFLTAVHELGHQICPIGESLLFELERPALPLSREEACAYLFEYLCIVEFPDEFVRDVLVRWFAEQRDRLVSRYQAGSNDEHAIGMALFDAALTLYPPQRAWMELAAGRELNPELLRRLEGLRSERRNGSEASEVP